MDDLNNFYASILNLKNTSYSLIEKIVRQQKAELLEHTNDLSGFCKYIASTIEEELRKNGIICYYIDLNEILNVDHVFLIAEYKSKNIINRVLIDPTFEQFNKKDNHQLKYLKEWPSEKIKDKKIINDLINIGLTNIDNNSFNQYINSFSSNINNYNLEEFLINTKLKDAFEMNKNRRSA